MEVRELVNCLNIDFYTGVPDSQLKPFCDYLYQKYGVSNHHIIAANEGNAVGLAAGYHLATGKIPAVYLQNSGMGNALNPIVSLLHEKVYGIPCIFVIGWRGEPGTHDEPQHIFQGEITPRLLELMDMKYFVVDKGTAVETLQKKMKSFQLLLKKGKSVAFLIKKGALDSEDKVVYCNEYPLNREEIIEEIVKVTGRDLIISTTGKVSRELFEVRERNDQDHELDFLTVGSMGHSSSIAQAIARFRPEKKVWCIDGDGAALMHLGAMAVGGSSPIGNMVHILINNEAHETVGGMPTVSKNVDWVLMAKACGYPFAIRVSGKETLIKTLNQVKQSKELCFVEVRAGLGARGDLGRPTAAPEENKKKFQKNLQIF